MNLKYSGIEQLEACMVHTHEVGSSSLPPATTQDMIVFRMEVSEL